MIVENVPRDEHEVDLVLGGVGSELLDGLEPSFADPVARAVFKPSDTQAQMKICGMQKLYHFISATIAGFFGSGPAG